MKITRRSQIVLKICAIVILTADIWNITGGLFAEAAPIPGTSSSMLVSPELGVYRSPLGFQLNAGDSGWIHSQPPAQHKFVSTVYRLPGPHKPSAKGMKGKELKSKGEKVSPQPNASLTVRVDELKKDIPLRRYARLWLKEYPKYGFDVLGSKAFKQNKLRGHVFDLISRDSGKQIRQVVFVKDKRAVILTCRDSITSFKESLKGCNQIIRTFKW